MRASFNQTQCRPLFFARSFDDLGEAARVEAGSANKRAVDVGLAHEFAGILRFHAAAVLNSDPVGCGVVRHFAQDVPNERVRYSDKFDDPNLPGEMETTVSLRQVSCGTDVSIVQEGVPDVIPVEMCHLGWQESLEQLKRLVEPVIPD